MADDSWISPALDYIGSWLEFQMRQSELPGCAIAIAHRGQIIREEAFGCADLSSGEAFTPRHRFRIASHSKSFTAAGIMKLREHGRLKLDDPVGDYVADLHPRVAAVTIAQLLSHTAGIIRDGADSGQFQDRRPFPDTEELLAVLKDPPIIEPNTRFKYSNHGFSLLGIVIENITGEPYRSWIKREIVEAAGLEETEPDMPLSPGTPFARGHTGKLPLGRRLVIPGDFSTNALQSAGGFVGTAHDLALYFAQLSPGSEKSVLSADSCREMTRRQWRTPHSSIESYYGYGIASGSLDGWDWFGHGGGLQGYISRTAVVPEQDLAISILTNAIDGWAGPWVDGAIRILRRFAREGAPSPAVSDWTGRWWTVWGAGDLVPMGEKVVAANPHFLLNPFMDASEIEITGPDQGRIAVAAGSGSHGEEVRRVRDGDGNITELWFAATKFLPEAEIAAEIEARYPHPTPGMPALAGGHPGAPPQSPGQAQGGEGTGGGSSRR
jgi:CubicO group peptidase (beta-lactamase class C family)